MKVSGWVACLGTLLSACEGGAGKPDGGSEPGDSSVADIHTEERLDDTEADAPRIIECQPGSQQTCRGDDACWGHRNCSDQYKLGDCICETGAGGAGGAAAGDAPSD
jgi:hypothetical protein